MEARAPGATALLLTWLALLALLAATAAASTLALGPLNLVVSVAIAALKTALVVLVFMGVPWHSRASWLWAGAGFYWLGIMLVLALGDYLTRGWLPLPGK
jgi:cytochrome c oxidase subunit 4